MNINTSQTIEALGITSWVMYGAEPTTEREFYERFRKIIGTDQNGVPVESSNAADFGVTWSQIETKRAELVIEVGLRKLRQERDRRLAETDWWVLPDRTPTAEQLAYRQALRDITNTYSSITDVVWPVKP